MVLLDITNATNGRQPDKLDTAALAEKLHTKALQQENLLLRAEIEELRAEKAAAVVEPRTPRAARGVCSAPSTPKRPADRRGEGPCPTTPRTPRTPRTPTGRMADRAVSCAPRGREASAPISRPTMPRPASWGPVKAAKTTPRTGRPQPKKEAQPAPAPAPTSKVNSSTGTRAAWANALWEQRQRTESAFEALASMRQRLKERQGVRQEVLQRTAGLQRELMEATTGHPDRIKSLMDSAEGAAEGLKSAQEALQQEQEETESLRQKVLKDEGTLEGLRGQVQTLEEQSHRERQLRVCHMRREEALRSAIEAARAQQEARKALLAESSVVLQKLNNEILSLKGNIRVFCRLRPRLPQENQEKLRFEVADQQLTVYGIPQLNVTGLSEKTRSWSFDFDHIFRSEASQAEVFEEISLLVQSALDGYRVAILAYGQTGSGKTYTMLGPEEAQDPGVLPRTVDAIFKEVEQLKKNGWEFEVSASMAEVYNESVVDLIAKGGTTGDAASSPSAEPVRRVVRDAPAMYQLLRRASRERHVASTSANERSSRSHAVIQMAFVGRCTVPGMQREVSGLLSFVDLAGSERLAQTSATGERLKEAQHINRSLCALGDVIEAICRKGALRGQAAAAVHVPFRNSRLTMLLRDSLGGDSKTLMFANVSPLQEHLGETLSSLRFASKVHACCLGLAKRHVVEGNDEGQR